MDKRDKTRTNILYKRSIMTILQCCLKKKKKKQLIAG